MSYRVVGTLLASHDLRAWHAADVGTGSYDEIDINLIVSGRWYDPSAEAVSIAAPDYVVRHWKRPPVVEELGDDGRNQ